MLVSATIGVACLPAEAAPATLYDGADGATCDYYNYGVRVAWRHKMGDWQDAAGAEQGETPFARVRVSAQDENKVVRWEVTSLVQRWLSGRQRNDGVLIKALRPGPDGTARFHSREASDPRVRPVLVVRFANGRSERIVATSDTTLNCSTYTSLGTQTGITASLNQYAVAQFDLTSVAGAGITQATLEFTLLRSYDGPVDLGVFALLSPFARDDAAAAPRPGLAARYSRDKGIERHPAVMMATGFDELRWQSAWTMVNPRSFTARVDRAAQLGFEPLVGQALQVAVPAGQNLGLDLGYQFAKALGTEPDEVFFRYYLRLASDWEPSAEGGKLPGISATYNQSGWGGRKADGSSGWSMRGLYLRPPEPGNPLHGITAVGTYAYHADMTSDYGDNWFWSGGGRGLLARNRWYCIEQQFKVNTLGKRDGVFRAWVDGRLVFEKTDIHVRDVSRIHIEQIWMNVYHGGLEPAAKEIHLFIDNVVVAREYIGPMGE